VRHKRIYLAWLVFHFLIIVAISCHDVIWLVAHRLTALPSSWSYLAQKVEPITSHALGQTLASSNPLRRAFLTYCHLAGTERGYGYFAPNVPDSFRLGFGIDYANGRSEYTLPAVNSRSAGVRVASLLDEIGRTPYPALREYVVKTIAGTIWREHPDAIKVRAVFGVTKLPSIVEFEQGKREGFEFLYGYDFSRHEAAAPLPQP
jgi:hypothetical protein